MKQTKKMIAIVLALMLLMSQAVFAEDAVTTAAQPVSSPSAWAIWDIQMASIYGLGTVETYANYQSAAVGSQYTAIGATIEQKFSVKDTTPVAADILTRGELLKELYDLVVLALKPTDAKDAVSYFVDNGLMQGRTNKDYALDKPCTIQEMLVLSKRTYDHLIYGLNLDAKGMFWKVSDADNTVYLLGSVHLTDGSVYPMSKEILTAYATSDVLAVEANVLAQNQEGIAYMQEKMMIPGTATIDTLISKETYAAYVKTMDEFGIPAEFYNKIKPWYASLLLLNLKAAAPSSGAAVTASMGIDVYFLAQASGSKTIMELESIKSQVDMMDSFSQALQERDLASALAPAAEGETVNDGLKGILDIWHAGDVAALTKLIQDSKGTTTIDIEYNTKMWDNRDAAMSVLVADMLQKDSEKDFFVVLGAGHMVTDSGIVKRLEAKGYTVEQVK